MLHQHQQMELVYCNCIRVIQWARHVLFRERGRETEIETETGVPVIILDSMHNFIPLLWFQKDWGIPKTILVNINHNWLKHWEDVHCEHSNIGEQSKRVVRPWHLSSFPSFRLEAVEWIPDLHSLVVNFLLSDSPIYYLSRNAIIFRPFSLRTGIMCHMWAYFILESASKRIKYMQREYIGVTQFPIYPTFKLQCT